MECFVDIKLAVCKYSLMEFDRIPPNVRQLGGNESAKHPETEELDVLYYPLLRGTAVFGSEVSVGVDGAAARGAGEVGWSSNKPLVA